MKINLLKWPFYCFAGLASITILTISLLISYLYFPNFYSFFTNYVSELGNPMRNPQGAIYFNVGAMLTGISLFPFFVGIHLWYSEVIWKNIFLIASQLAGAFAAFSLILVGFFPENHLIEHLFWSYSFFFSILYLLPTLSSL